MSSLTGAFAVVRGHRFSKWYPDAAAILAIAVLATLVVSTLFHDGRIVLGGNVLVNEMPMWTYLGQRLHGFELPAWNPYQYGGTPFAADPGSGWMYLPVMLLFTLLSTTRAVAFLLVAHYLIAATGSFVFARRIGLDLAGATATGIAVVTSNWFYTATIDSPARIEAMAWLPWLLLFAAHALEQRTLIRQIAFTGFAGAALGEIVGAWYGKGALYAVLLAIAWLAYLAATAMTVPMRERLVRVAATSAGIAVWTVVLAAGGLLPRALADDLSHADRLTARHSLGSMLGSLLGGSRNGAGDIVIFLAVVAVVIAGRRFSAPFFTGVILVGLIIDVGDAMLLAALPLAVLAGIATTLLLATSIDRRRGYVAVGGTIAAYFVIQVGADTIGTIDRIGTFVAILALTAVLFATSNSTWRLALIFLILLLQAATFIDRADDLRHDLGNTVGEVDPNAQNVDTPAITFLKAQIAKGGKPVRFLGYDPAGTTDYSARFADPAVQSIEVNNRATALQLYDVQGSGGPTRTDLSKQLLARINGTSDATADGDATVLPNGLNSPFLDLLNVKYILLPANSSTTDVNVAALLKRYRAVYKDSSVLILDRGTNFGPAFLVSSVVPVDSTASAFDLVAKGPDAGGASSQQIRLTAPVLNATALDQPASPRSLGSTTVTAYAPEKIEVQTRAIGDRQLVISEIAYPGWKATIDGKQVPIETAYGAFRSVRVPAGDHTVTFTFRPTSLLAGTIASIVAYLALAACAIWLLTTPPFRRDFVTVLGETLRWPTRPAAGVTGVEAGS